MEYITIPWSEVPDYFYILWKIFFLSFRLPRGRKIRPSSTKKILLSLTENRFPSFRESQFTKACLRRPVCKSRFAESHFPEIGLKIVLSEFFSIFIIPGRRSFYNGSGILQRKSSVRNPDRAFSLSNQSGFNGIDRIFKESVWLSIFTWIPSFSLRWPPAPVLS